MTPTEAALRAALETNGGPVSAEDTVDGKEYVLVRMDAFKAMEAALAAPPHGKDAGEEPETAALKPESEWDVPYVLRLAEQRDALRAELQEAWNKCGDAETALSRAQARLAQAEGLLERIGPILGPFNWAAAFVGQVAAFLKQGTP